MIPKSFKSVFLTLIPACVRERVKRLPLRLLSLPGAYNLWTRYLKSPQSFLPEKLAASPKLSLPEFQLLMLDSWYHDFETLGMKTGILHPNQRCKQQVLFPFIDRAISICRDETQSVCGVELFCADGFYANYAVQQGAFEMLGIDMNDYYVTKAKLITKVLGNTAKIRFCRQDVFQIKESFDFCICAGGLYHISNPHELLALLRRKIRLALVIQTVYSLANTDQEYFESPAPGWTWGCRFSYRYLISMVKRTGWSILSEETNELEGNNRLEDRGSAYLLCVPSGGSRWSGEKLP